MIGVGTGGYVGDEGWWEQGSQEVVGENADVRRV